MATYTAPLQSTQAPIRCQVATNASQSSLTS